MEEINVEKYVSVNLRHTMDWTDPMNRITESSTKQIGINNKLISTLSSMNPYALYKVFHETPVPVDSDRLFSFQHRTSTVNSDIIELLVHKYDGVARSTGKILSKQTAPTTSADINILAPINVAAHAEKLQATTQDTETLRKQATNLLKQRPNDVGLLLTVIQLNVEEGRFINALALLKTFLDKLNSSISESDQDVRYNPGLISIYVALCKVLGNDIQAQDELMKAAKYWQPRADQTPALLRAAGASLVSSFRSEDDLSTAADIFARLRELDPYDKFARAGYVAAHALTEPEKIANDASSLTKIPELISDIDVGALEEDGVATLPKQSQPTKRPAAADDKKDESGEQPKKKRCLRKSRIPKEYDPNKQPDPERWLPLRDRSSYRPPKGKKAKQRAADRTQGGIVADDAAPVAQPSPVATQSKGGASSSKKKKGKGRR